MVVTERVCRSCLHYNAPASECRRYPPTPVPATFLIQLPSASSTLIPGINQVATANLQVATSQWSRVPPDAWCGEFLALSSNT